MNFLKNILLIFLFSKSLMANEPERLEAIQVRGTKEEKTYFQNTESISILQSHELPVTGRENNLQILNAVPNVEVNKNGESFSIRGINNMGVTGYQKDNLSSILIDQIFQTDLAIQAGSFDLWDMDRIEVLRGAQSTSQGVNSLAGAILLDRNRPQWENEGSAKIGFGQFAHRELGVMSNQVLLNDKLTLRLAYDKELNDGYIKNLATQNNKWGKWDKDRVNLGVALKTNENDVLNFTAKFHQNRQGGTYTQGTDAFKYEVNEDEDYDLSTQNYQLGFDYNQIHNEKWSQITALGISQSKQKSFSDSDGTAQDTAGIRVENHKDQFVSFETRLNYKSENIKNLLGLHIHDFSLNDDYDFNLLFPLGATASTPVAVAQEVNRKRQVYALFDSLTYSFDGQHSMVAGARAEMAKATYGTDVFAQRLQNLGNTLNTTVDNYISQISGAYEGKKDSVVILPKLGYNFENDVHYAGASYTRGYRTAGVSINRRRALAVEYDPEFTNNYELSYKYSGESFQFSSNMFYIDWSKQQVQVQLSNDFYDTQVQNAASSEVYGAEVEGKIKLTDAQGLNLGVGYSDTKFKNFETRSENYKNKKFPFASNWTGRLGHDWKVTEQMSLFTVVRYLSDSFSNAENTKKSDAQFYLNLNGRYSLKTWILEAYVNNVLNGEYRIFDGSPTSTTSPYQASYHQTSTPREVGARATYFW